MNFWKGKEITPLPGIEFNEKDHSYKLNGRPMRSVTWYTSKLKDYSFVSDVDKNWGTARHDHLYHLDMGTLDYSKVDPSMEPYIKGWQWVLESNGWSVDRMLAEQTVYSIKYWLAGRFDRLFEKDREDVLVDFKSGPLDKTVGLQLAAYGKMAIENKFTVASRLKLAGVSINPEGKVTTKYYDFKSNWNLFLMQYSLQNFLAN